MKLLALMKCLLISFALSATFNCFSQFKVTIPSSASVNVNFGAGNKNPGAPLPVGSTDFTYITNLCPKPGEYSVVNTDNCFTTIQHDAGHFFFGVHPTEDEPGYMMLANYAASTTSKTVFEDTVKNLCSNNNYLFWAGIVNLSKSSCFYPNLSFIVTTLSGASIQSFPTGDVGGANDKGAPYFGYQVPDEHTSFPNYYGGIFSLPAGINTVIVKIVTNPTNANAVCTNTIAIDNIIVMPVGPGITIEDAKGSDGYITGTCFKNGDPVMLNGSISNGYYSFGDGKFTPASFANPGFQWQQSVDNGYTWNDIPGETAQNISRSFSIADTFYVRLRTSEDYNINNQKCSVISNVIQVQVDGLPKDFDITSNTPVCTDSDIVLNVTGGATYVINGPNGFYDNSSNPHVYHPVLADSGWYYAQIKTFGGCTVNDSTFVKVIGPDLKISADDSAICYGESTHLHSSGGSIYLWSPVAGLSNANIPDPVANPIATTKYQLKITDESGCGAYGNVIIKLRDSLLKAQLIAPKIICPNDVALYRDTSIGKIENWYWTFGNGQTSNQQNPPAQRYPQFETAETYPVTLTVTDSAGCSNAITAYVKAVDNCYIAVPSAFTPNHDGLNDYLFPMNAYKATNLTFIIYNRFGQIVFSTKDWTRKWDGTINALPQPTGTYVWILRYTDENNKIISLKGTTVLLR